MKWLHIPTSRHIDLCCTIVLVIISFCFSGFVLFERRLSYRMRPYSASSGDQTDLAPIKLTCDLPDGWEADLRGQELWLVHSNSDGTVSNAISFDCPANLNRWIDTHPDFNDADFDNLVLQIAKHGLK